LREFIKLEGVMVILNVQTMGYTPDYNIQ